MSQLLWDALAHSSQFPFNFVQLAFTVISPFYWIRFIYFVIVSSSEHRFFEMKIAPVSNVASYKLLLLREGRKMLNHIHPLIVCIIDFDLSIKRNQLLIHFGEIIAIERVGGVRRNFDNFQIPISTISTHPNPYNEYAYPTFIFMRVPTVQLQEKSWLHLKYIKTTA